MMAEYLHKCLQNYINDKFEIEEALFLFSYLVKNQVADKLSTQFKETAQHLVNINWLSTEGKILIDLDEAQEEARQVQEQMNEENNENEEKKN